MLSNLAKEISRLDRSHGGEHAHVDLLTIARRYGAFLRTDLTYDDDNPGPPAIVLGNHCVAENIVCAHYDTMGNIAGGADNASGVACALAIANVLGGLLPDDCCIALLPREEPPFFASTGMGSAAFARLVPEHAKVFAVDTIGGRADLGPRTVMLSERTRWGAQQVFPDSAHDKRLYMLSDARNFKNGVLLTDEFVLSVPMHTVRDTVENVDWSFVHGVVDTLSAWFRERKGAGEEQVKRRAQTEMDPDPADLCHGR